MCDWVLIMKKWLISLVICSVSYGYETSYWLAQKELLSITEKPRDILKLASPLYYMRVLNTNDVEHIKVEQAINTIVKSEQATWSEKALAWSLKAEWKVCAQSDATSEKKEAYRALQKTTFEDKVQRQIMGMFEQLWLRCTKK